MRSSLFFMFLTYKEKSHGLCQHLNQAELTLGNTPVLPQGTEGGGSRPQRSHEAGCWLPGALDILVKKKNTLL